MPIKRKYRSPETIRQMTACRHKCPCGVEMVGNEPHLEAWLNQHLTLSKIHKDWQINTEMHKLEVEVMIDNFLEGDK
jgi:hypothetical protein